MRINSSTRFAAMAVLFGALACAGNQARTDDETAAARDTTTSDTLGGQQNPPGYRGMERDTTIAPPSQQPSDTFLQNQGVGGAQDTSGYTGAERTDTTGQANQQAPSDTSSFRTDTTSAADSSWSKKADTTGHHPSQHQPADSTARQ
jgi:hypothetical protein